MADSERAALEILVSLHRLIRSLRQASAEQPVQPTQLAVLAALYDAGPCRVSTIAGQIGCSQPTATTVVASLQERDLVVREPDPEDGRAVRVRATQAGLDVLRSLADSQAGVPAERLRSLSEEDTALLGELARILRELAAPVGSAVR